MFISVPEAFLSTCDSLWLQSEVKRHGLDLPGGLLIPWLILHPDHEQGAFLAITRFALELCPTVERFALCVESPIPISQPFLALYCGAKPVAEMPNCAALHIVPRRSVLPTLTIRPASIGDADDIVPLLQAAQTTHGALAQVRHLGAVAVSKL